MAAAVAAAASVVAEQEIGGGTVVSWVASGVVLWSTAFVLVRALLPKRSYDFCNRAVSTMHAVTAVCLALLSVADWSCPVCPLASQSSPRQVRTSVSLFSGDLGRMHDDDRRVTII